MSIPTINNAIVSLKSHHNSVMVMINRLNQFGTFVGHDSKDEIRQELSDSIQLEFRQIDKLYKEIIIMVDDLNGSRDFATSHSKSHPSRQGASYYDEELIDLKVKIEKIGQEITISRNSFRRAQLQAKKNINLSKLKEREILQKQLLFGDGSSRDKKSPRYGSSKEELVLNKSKDITTVLKRMHQLAEVESLKSELTISEIKEQSQSLHNLDVKYSTFDIVLKSSSYLVKQIEQADKQDKYYIYASLGFLALTVCWIIWRRILKGPIYLLLWTIVKLFNLAAWFSKPLRNSSASPSYISSSISTSIDVVTAISVSASSVLAAPDLLDLLEYTTVTAVLATAGPAEVPQIPETQERVEAVDPKIESPESQIDNSGDLETTAVEKIEEVGQQIQDEVAFEPELLLNEKAKYQELEEEKKTVDTEKDRVINYRDAEGEPVYNKMDFDEDVEFEQLNPTFNGLDDTNTYEAMPDRPL